MKTILLLIFIIVSSNLKAQAIQWINSWGSQSTDYVKSIEHYNNHLYLGGGFNGTVALNASTTITSNGGEDLFISKYTQDGQLVWIKTIGGSSEWVDFKLDPQGNIIILGKFSGTVDFDPSNAVYNLSSVSNCCQDIFFAKYTNNGDFVWAKNLGGLDFAQANSIAIDNTGDFYIAGVMNGSLDLDPGPNSYILNTNSNGFFAKYSSSGYFQLAKTLESSNNGSSEIYTITVDNTNNFNNVYLAGNFVNSVEFDPDPISTVVASSAFLNDYDAFFARYTPLGDLVWVHTFGSMGMDYINQIKGDNNGKIYLSGSISTNSVDFDSSPITITSIQNNGSFLASFTSTLGINWVINTVGTKFDFSTQGVLVAKGDLTTPNLIGNFQRISLNGLLLWEKVSGYNISDVVDLGTSFYLSGALPNWQTEIDPGEYYDTITTNGLQDVCFSKYFDCSTQTEVNSIVNFVENVTCYSGNNGSVSFQGTGGVPPYSNILIAGTATGPSLVPTTSLPAGVYTGVVYDSNRCEDTSIITVSQPSFTPAAVCLVTVDSLSQNNLIVWDKSLFANQPIDSFIIHREVQTNLYLPLGAVSFSDLSIFIDTFRTKYFQSPYWSLGDPNSGTYRYKIQWKDTCGNLSPLSDFHNTIFMTNNNGVFSWPQLYTIENASNPVSQYLLLRDNFNNGNWQVVNSVSGTQQSITDPAYATWASTANYKVVTQWVTSCVATQIPVSGILPVKSSAFFSSQSNTLKPVLGINEVTDANLILIFPNPTNGVFHVSFTESMLNEQIEVYDLEGRVVYKTELTEINMELNLEQLAKGTYWLRAGHMKPITFIKQ